MVTIQHLNSHMLDLFIQVRFESDPFYHRSSEMIQSSFIKNFSGVRCELERGKQNISRIFLSHNITSGLL